VTVPSAPDPETDPEPDPETAPGVPLERQQNQSILDSILNGDVPLSAPASAAWSLLSLLLGVLGALFAVLQLLRALLFGHKRDEYEASDENLDNTPKNAPTALLVVSATLGMVPVLAFLLLDNLSLPIVWVNTNTIFVGLAFLLDMVVLIASFLAKRSEPTKSVI
jgi:hypothetical protein